ncbi:MAG: ATP-binding protein [Verrucomicrobiales bacterium]|jgi:signal transduction histidine kinase|nr:ATP-binding protein [Verrucomicrobiales bacterium]MDF1785597.1 ATP-binding protein [Verrucomicrobiales bacterium]
MRDGQCYIRVSDKGAGIRSRDRARIFESFQRLDASLTEPASSAGLGLSIAHSLAKRLGGELEVSWR